MPPAGFFYAHSHSPPALCNPGGVNSIPDHRNINDKEVVPQGSALLSLQEPPRLLPNARLPLLITPVPRLFQPRRHAAPLLNKLKSITMAADGMLNIRMLSSPHKPPSPCEKNACCTIYA
jgi:hypothetical protein